LQSDIDTTDMTIEEIKRMVDDERAEQLTAQLWITGRRTLARQECSIAKKLVQNL